jgi:peptidylamidoglycolate lyase
MIMLTNLVQGSKHGKLITFIAIVFLSGCSSSIKTDNKIRYSLDQSWPQLPANYVLGNPTGIGIDSHQNIIVFHRAERTWPTIGAMPATLIPSKTIIVLDKETGTIINSWGDNLFIMPHGLTVDKDDNIWVTDVGLHQVFKFDHNGKLLMKLGEEKIAGNDTLHFNMPTGIAVARDGSFYVSDGYGNSRIMKFSADGKYISQWGSKGNKKGQFNIPHAVCLDDKGNVYVADRENKRVEVFDSGGKFRTQWTNKNFGRICSITYDSVSKYFFAVDDKTSFLNLAHRGSDVIIFDTAGNTITNFGRSGAYDGPRCWYHDIAVDSEQNIYVGDILGNRIQKFRKLK